MTYGPKWPRITFSSISAFIWGAIWCSFAAFFGHRIWLDCSVTTDTCWLCVCMRVWVCVFGNDSRGHFGQIWKYVSITFLYNSVGFSHDSFILFPFQSKRSQYALGVPLAAPHWIQMISPSIWASVQDLANKQHRFFRTSKYS